jgi:hypothetical protein
MGEATGPDLVSSGLVFFKADSSYAIQLASTRLARYDKLYFLLAKKTTELTSSLPTRQARQCAPFGITVKHRLRRPGCIIICKARQSQTNVMLIIYAYIGSKEASFTARSSCR